MAIEVKKLSDEEITSMGITSWPIWTKEVSTFDWHYDSVEECLLLEGEVTVTTEDGEKVTFGAGDFVTFPEGLHCTWDVTKPVKKHYTFK